MAAALPSPCVLKRRRRRRRRVERLNRYYSAGLLSGITTPSGRSIAIARNSNNFISVVSDQIGRTWQYLYDGNGLLKTVVYPDTTTEAYTYAIWPSSGPPVVTAVRSTATGRHHPCIHQRP